MSSIIDTDPTMKALQFTMDGLSKRVQVATNNITNADTPNFKASAVTFEDSLRTALAGNQTGGLPLTLTDGADIDPSANSSQPSIVETQLATTSSKNDNNNVDIDNEMTTLADSNIMYSAMVQLTASKLAILKSAVTDTKP